MLFYYPLCIKYKEDVTEAIIVPDSNKTIKENNVVDTHNDTVLQLPVTGPQRDDKVTPLAPNANSTGRSDNKTDNECKNDNIQDAQNCIQFTTELNKLKDKDAVLEYVSSKNDDPVHKKASGHIRNSLRRRRSLKIKLLDSIKSDSAPEILNYETRHGPRDRETLLPIYQLTPNQIQNANLADFNIETLHEPARDPDGYNNKKDGKGQQSDKQLTPREDSDDSRERDGNSEEKPNDASDESIERNNDESRERIHSQTKEPPNSNESLENEDMKSPLRNDDSREKQESAESGEELSNDFKNNAVRGRNIDSEEVEEHPNNRGATPREKFSENSNSQDERGPKYSSEDSEESKEEIEIPNDKLKQLTFGESDQAGPNAIQDVDLDDFSYERIQVNKDGKVELDKDTHNKDDHYSEEVIPADDNLNKEKPQSEYIKKVNNGEIKPVVEINTESNSNEYSDEVVDILPQQHKPELKSGHTSLETLLGAEKNNDAEKNEKQIIQNNEQPDGNVKQQFERIPLNYKHDKKTENRQEENDARENNTEKDKDGTLDTLLPKDQRYDEKLSFKFDDVSIKLPDIKLPDDILSYNYESPYAKKHGRKHNKHKDRFYHYSDEHSDENPIKEISIPQYDDDRGYYRYEDPEEKKQAYKKRIQQNSEEADDDHVDLYEKFVRERFGKRDSFEKRSEQLRNEVFRPSNPKLSETIKQVLKRSEETQKEAEKSGDPKAGYMWTLEYGENL